MSFLALKHRPGKPKKQKIAVFDLETNRWTNFLVGSFFDGFNEIVFKSIPELVDILTSTKYYGYKIYAHYGGKFDILFLLDALENYRTEIVEINGHILQIKISFNFSEKEHRFKNHIYVRDSFKLLDRSLDELTTAFDVEHLKGSMDFRKELKITKELLVYLRNDVKGLYEVLTKFQSLVLEMGGQLKLTLPGTALDLFQREYIPSDLIIPTYPKYNDIIRSAYFGGRTENFKKYFKATKEKPFLYYYDVNSLYPFIMANFDFPVGNPDYILNYNYNKNDIGFADVEIIIPDTEYAPIVPVHSGEFMLFPNGRIRGVYTLETIRGCLKRGYKIKFFNALLFTRKKLFKKYVNDFYKMRMNNKDNVLNLIAKLFMNSLYGKFGQKLEHKSYIYNPTLADFEKHELTNYDEYLDIWYYKTEQLRNYILPAIPAYVTAYAINLLSDLIQQAGDEIYYCDTDSIFTTKEFPTGKKLGELKLECKIKEAVFLAPKTYYYKDVNNKHHIRVKGFPYKKTQKKIKRSHFIRALDYDLDGFKVKGRRVLGFKSAIKAKENKDKKFVYFGKYKKSLKKLDTKRKFIDNYDSEAFNIDFKSENEI